MLSVCVAVCHTVGEVMSLLVVNSHCFTVDLDTFVTPTVGVVGCLSQLVTAVVMWPARNDQMSVNMYLW